MQTINPQLKIEQFQNLLKASKPAIVTSLLLGLVLVFAEHNVSNPKMMLIWFVILLIISLIRIKLINTYQHTHDSTVPIYKIRLRNIRIGTFVSGILWGSIGVLLFTTNDILHLVFLIFILAGLTAGNTVSNASDLISSTGFSIVTLSPITLSLFLSGTEPFIYMGLALILYFGFLITISRYIHVNIAQQMYNRIRLENSENTLKYLLKMSPIAVRIAKNEGQEVIFANEAYAHLIHADISDVLGKNPKNYYADQEKYLDIVSQVANNETIDNQLIELIVNTKTIWVLASYMPIEFEGESCVLGWFYDITKEKNLQTELMEHSQRLEYIAHYDALTGLPNRILESDRLQQGIMQTQRHGSHLAVFYLDLDGFKHVNDSYGHAVGDQLLIHLSVRMKQALREGDTLCRLGGDEFVAILADLHDVSDAMPIIHRLLDAASQPIRLGDFSIQVSASIGVAFYPQDGEVNGDQLVRQADQAMYIAKQSGKNRYHIFEA